MKQSIAAMLLMLGGCASGTLPSVPWAQRPRMSESACAESCNAHYDECPQVFANFPERGSVECPAEHDNCLKSCEKQRDSASTAPSAMVSPPTPASSKETRLKELKHFYEEGLVSDDVYKERQRAILAEP